MINLVELDRNQGSKLGVYVFLKLGFTFRPSSLIYNGCIANDRGGGRLRGKFRAIISASQTSNAIKLGLEKSCLRLSDDVIKKDVVIDGSHAYSYAWITNRLFPSPPTFCELSICLIVNSVVAAVN